MSGRELSGYTNVRPLYIKILLLFLDGKFTFVDHRVVNIMGFTPPELLGKSCFELIHTEDQTHMKDSFDQVIKMKGQVFTFMYR